MGLFLVRTVSALGAVVGFFLALLTYQFNHGCSFCALGASCPSVCLSTDTIAFIIVFLAVAVISLVVLVRSFLASKLSKHRDDSEAIGGMLEAKKNAHDSHLETIFTDGHRSHNEGISYAWFNGLKPKHVAKAGIRKPNTTNNRVERLNGTLRERVKVQRVWKSMKTPLAEGQRFHYNFVKPHQALEGQTPADRAGVGVEGENKWLTLLRNAIAKERGSSN